MTRSPACIAMLALLVFVSMLPQAAGCQSLRILARSNPPYALQTMADGEQGDASIEVVHEIQRRLHATGAVIRVPWARAMRMLEQGPNTVLCGIARTAQRNQRFRWVGPLSESTYILYVRTTAPQLASLDQARHLRSIGVVRDDARDQLLSEAGFSNLDRADDSVTNVRKLMAGHVDAFASSDVMIDRLLNKSGVARSSVREGLRFHQAQTWLAFSPDTPASTIADWQRTLDAMQKDHTLQGIMRKFNPNWVAPGRPITQFD